MPEGDQIKSKQDAGATSDRSPDVQEPGSHAFPFSRGRMGFVAVDRNKHAIILPEKPDSDSVLMKELFESALAEDQIADLGRFLFQNDIAIILSASAELAAWEREALESKIQYIEGRLSFGKLTAQTEKAKVAGCWTVPFEIIALTLVPCNSFPVNGWTGYLPLEQDFEAIKQRIEDTREARKEIDEKHETWRRECAEPVLHKLHDLDRESFPPATRHEISELLDQFYQESYFPISHAPSVVVESLKSKDWNGALAAMRSHVEHASAWLRPLVQQILDEIAKAKDENADLFPSLDQKRRFALELQTLLDRLGLRLCCPKCSEPAVLIVSEDVPEGRFRFLHGNQARHHSSKHVPPLRLIEQSRSRRKSDD